MKTRVSLKYFVNDCLWKQSLDSILPQIPSNLISLKIFGNSKYFHLKLEQLSCKNVLKIALRVNCFYDLFTEVEIWYYKTLKFVLTSFLKEKVTSSLNMTVSNNCSC